MTYVYIRKKLSHLACAVLCAALYTPLSPQGFASENRYVIHIDSPSFRKLVTAVPVFDIEGTKDDELRQLSIKGKEHLDFLLSYTGLFNIMSEEAYPKLLTPAGTHTSTLSGFEDVDLTAWKSIGVESLTVSKIAKEGKTYRVEFRSVDTHKMQKMLSKSYIMSSPGELYETAKLYVDKLLEAYTGRPGIFSTKFLFIGRERKESFKQVYMCDVDGKNLKQLTHSKSPHLSPSWHPDRSKVLYTAYDAGNPDLYMLDLKTMKQTKISAHKGINSGGVFSPNGEVIAFTGSVSGNADIYTSRAHKGEAMRIPLLQGHGIDVDPMFSPDGKSLAFVSGRFGNPHIFVAQLEWSKSDTTVKVLSDKRLTYAGWYNATPAWSPKGEKLAFAGFDKEVNRFDLFLMNPDGTQLERLTLNSGDNESPGWSPNSQLIVFHSNRQGNTNQKAQSRLFLMNKDGSEQRPIPLPLYDAQTPRWGPL